ncbi:MAG: thermonuclease family protein, partial [Pseudomonadota bacterium]
YKRTKVSEAKGERWFCDEREAVQAGWRAPHWP